MQVPSHVYKYESLSMQTLENLVSQVIYFGTPSNFNDPYDCALPTKIRILSDAEVTASRDTFLADPALTCNARLALLAMPLPDLKRMLHERGQEAMVRFSQQLHQRGVSCFSESNDNLLMWSHYGGRYKGICLEFSSCAPVLAKLRKVDYRDHFPEVQLAGVFSDNADENIVDSLLCTKSTAWSYEREWRVIHKTAGTAYKYSAQCLTAVYFGPEISKESIRIVRLILEARNPTLTFWRGRRSDTEFKVVYEELPRFSGNDE